jgi:O-antigen/teichoic acid export membrane protein
MVFKFEWGGRSRLIRVSKDYWSSGGWLSGSAILQWISINYFYYVAAVMFGAVAAGAIRAAHNLMGLTHVVFQALENIIPQRASMKYIADGANGMNSYLNKANAYLFISTILISMGVAIFAQEIANLVYGSIGFDEEILYWFVVIYMIMSLGYTVKIALRVMERTDLIFKAAFKAIIISFPTTLIATQWFGVESIMTGMLLLQITTFSMMYKNLNIIQRQIGS